MLLICFTCHDKLGSYFWVNYKTWNYLRKTPFFSLENVYINISSQTLYVIMHSKKKFQDTHQRIIRSCKSKEDRQYNDQKKNGKKDKRYSIKLYIEN